MEGERGRSSPRAGRPAAARSETQMRSLCYAAWEGTRRGASPCGRASGLCMSTGWSNAGSCRSGGGADPHAKRHSRIPAARASRDPAGAAGRHERDGHGRARAPGGRLHGRSSDGPRPEIADSLGPAYRVAFGETLTEHIHWLRVERARILFRSTGWPIERVASEVGFRDKRYFRRVFKRRGRTNPRRVPALAPHLDSRKLAGTTLSIGGEGRQGLSRRMASAVSLTELAESSVPAFAPPHSSTAPPRALHQRVRDRGSRTGSWSSHSLRWHLAAPRCSSRSGPRSAPGAARPTWRSSLRVRRAWRSRPSSRRIRCALDVLLAEA